MLVTLVVCGLLASAHSFPVPVQSRCPSSRFSVPSRHGPVQMKRAAKNKVAKSAGTGAGRGFGAPSSKPPVRPRKSLDEAIAGFETRVPTSDVQCACGSGLTYAECCRPYHQRERAPETPTRTLRTRFSAFAYRLPAHLIRTTHPRNRDWDEDHARWARRLDREGMFDGFHFDALEVREEEDGAGADEAYVTFRATLVPRAGGAPQRFVERSQFLRDGEAGWLYGRGEVRSDDDWICVDGGDGSAGAQLLESARRSGAPARATGEEDEDDGTAG